MPPKFRKVACGSIHSIGIQEDGTLFQWGNTELRNGFRPMKALDIACTLFESVAIDAETGLAHQWGKYTGQMGSPPKMKLKAVAGCSNFFGGLTEDNTVVFWGNYGKLPRTKLPPLRSISGTIASSVLYGIKEDGTMVRITPPEMQYSSTDRVLPWNLPTDVKVQFVIGTDEFAVAILEDGTLKQWGATGRTLEVPNEEPPPGRFKSVSVNTTFRQEDEIAVAVREDGLVVRWGNPTPTPGFPPSTFVASQVVCGDVTVVAIGEDGSLYQWGQPRSRKAGVYTDFPGVIGSADRSKPLVFFDAQTPPTEPITNGMQMRSSETFEPHLTTLLPKGTLLFRGVRDSSQFTDDLMGVSLGEFRCLSPHYNVYFYPFPLVDSVVGRYSHYSVYVTTRDIPLLCLISPSTLTRSDKETERAIPITRCDKTPTTCGLPGRKYDACFKPDYLEEFPDVTGMLAIANEDRKAFNSELDDEPDGVLAQSIGTYVFPYLDRNDVRREGGIPEIVLHPFNRSLQSEYIFHETSIPPYVSKHKEYLNYQPLVVIDRTDERILSMMKALTSPEGFKVDPSTAPVHAKLNPSTGFFQLVELSDPASLDSSQPFRFVSPTTPSATTGSSRKTRRLRRGKGKKTRKGMIQ